MRKIGIALLFITSAAVAQQPPRSIYPSDYKPSPCEDAVLCQSFTKVDFHSAAFDFLLRDLDPRWEVAHQTEMNAMVKPYCRQRATCLTVPANDWMFCNDVFAQELRAQCEATYPVETQKHDYEQCRAWVDTYASGVDQWGQRDWKAARACAKQTPGPKSPGTIEWWSVPATIPNGYKGPIQIFTIDRDTHVPVETEIRFQDQIFYTPDAPTGRPTSYYVLTWPRKLLRVPNVQGHTDLVPPTMTFSAAGYETVSVPVPTIVPSMKVTMSPAADKLTPGSNTITITATDANTGKPVDAQVYFGEETVGFTNKPFELTIPRGKRADLWVRSPFDAYSDVVVVPARP
jgi:hypothetical protein